MPIEFNNENEDFRCADAINIDDQFELLKDSLDELMHGFDSEQDKADFILDICLKYREKLKAHANRI